MALLTDPDRAACRYEYSQDLSAVFEALGLNKAEIRDAVNAVDQWISDNQASYNSALPVAAQTAMTKSQKARLLTCVSNKRFVVDV